MTPADRIEALKDDGKCAEFTRRFIADLVNPAFGARSKGEIEALVIAHLAGCGLIDLTAPTYDLARKLNVTTAKARGLILQFQLRSNISDQQLDSMLRAVLADSVYGKDGTYMTFGLESPILKEHVMALLKRQKTFADSSFAKEIVRLPVSAFVDFIASFLQAPEQESIRTALVKFKLVEDTSFKGVAKGILRKLAEKVGDKAAGVVVDGAFDHLSEFVRSFVTGDAKGVGGAIDGLNLEPDPGLEAV